jgi:hypothetical protein
MTNLGKGSLFLEKLFFLLLVILLPTQVGHHFWPSWSLVFGIRVDYLSPVIYLTDILVFLIIFVSFNRIYRKIKRSLWQVLLIAVFVIINIFLASNPSASFFKWLKIIEFTLLAISLISNREFKLLNWFVLPFVSSLAVFSLIAIGQVIKGSTIGGALYFLGERTFNVSTPGIALMNLFGERALRAYSTFSHPNSFAGFLGVGLILLLTAKIKGMSSFVKLLFIGLFIVSFFLAMSVGATLALIGAMSFYFFWKKKLQQSHSLSNAVVFALVVLSLLTPLALRWKALAGQNVFERLNLSLSAVKMASNDPLWGVGLNNFIVELPKPIKNFGGLWLLQPVHNIFLLVFAEAGLIGLTIMVVIITKGLNQALKFKELSVAATLVFIVLTGVFDHYWLTLQQNSLLAFVILALCFKKNKGLVLN